MDETGYEPFIFWAYYGYHGGSDFVCFAKSHQKKEDVP